MTQVAMAVGLFMVAAAHQQVSFSLWMAKPLFFAMGAIAALYYRRANERSFNLESYLPPQITPSSTIVIILFILCSGIASKVSHPSHTALDLHPYLLDIVCQLLPISKVLQLGRQAVFVLLF